MANKFILFLLKEKNLKEEEDGRTVEVSEDVLNQLQAAHYFSMKKGKALYMLSKSKEFGMIKKMRKKSFKSFYPLNSNKKRKELQKRYQK